MPPGKEGREGKRNVGKLKIKGSSVCYKHSELSFSSLVTSYGSNPKIVALLRSFSATFTCPLGSILVTTDTGSKPPRSSSRIPSGPATNDMSTSSASVSAPRSTLVDMRPPFDGTSSAGNVYCAPKPVAGLIRGGAPGIGAGADGAHGGGGGAAAAPPFGGIGPLCW